ncbi:MAG: CDP-alcohol phosphatidyltransferase family protein [Ignavibacteriaceae bacterium]|nr:CDP-alcohol phosphatidyltransferase family protein [Ignavibacteriaceae bacterium]
MSVFQEYKSSLKIIAAEEFFDLILFRPLAFVFVKGVSSTRITPNQLTFISILFFLAAGICISTGSIEAVFAAGLLIGIGNVLDCADGQLARVKKAGSEYGRILDGIGDYVSAIALFIGVGIWGSSHSYDPLFWWVVVFAAGVTYGWQASLVDYYRNEFIMYAEGKQEFTLDEIKRSKDSLRKIKGVKGKRFNRFILSSYIIYSTLQTNIQPKRLKLDMSLSEQYVKNNSFILRLWCFNGTATPKFLSIVCCFFNRLDLFIIYVLVFGTLWSLFLLVLQKKVEKKILMRTI